MRFEPEQTEVVEHDTVMVLQNGEYVDITADKEDGADDTEVRK